MVEKVKSYFDIDPQLFGEKHKVSELLVVNIGYLNGIQPPVEYTEEKRKKIEELYRIYIEMGDINLLTRDFPVISCAVPNLNVTDSLFDLALMELIPDIDYNLAIIDGHHRVRYGPKYGIRDFYCSVYSLTQTLLNLKKQRKIDINITPKEYYKMLLGGMATTIDAFAHRGYSRSIIPVKLA